MVNSSEQNNVDSVKVFATKIVCVFQNGVQLITSIKNAASDGYIFYCAFSIKPNSFQSDSIQPCFELCININSFLAVLCMVETSTD